MKIGLVAFLNFVYDVGVLMVNIILCENCGKRKGTERWVGDGGMLIITHGFYSMWCPRCVARAQLRRALSRTLQIP